MTTTFVKIQTVTVGSGGAANIDFTSIPQTYTDLKIVISSRVSYATSGDAPYVDFNGLTTNRTGRFLEGSGSSTASATATRPGFISSGTNASTGAFGNAEIYIPNYTSNKFKTFSSDSVTENNSTLAYQWFLTSLWSSTDAVTRITLTPQSGSFVQYTTATLYGITNTPYASGGNRIYADATYMYHVFTSDGTFTPKRNLTVDYLVVAGGGGSRSYQSGGGGAGGVRCTVGETGGGGALESSLSVTALTNYSVTIGGGGAGASGGSTGNSGSNSVFGSITSLGGGGTGSGGGGVLGGTGGSGGGNGYGVQVTSASGTTGQGYSGGQGNNNATYRLGGGGGGAGGVGGNAATTVSGVGGAGITTSISGTSSSYGGGGSGGGASGSAGSASAGGGTGNVSFPATQLKGTDGTANTGGGAGGSPDYSGSATVQASGGSGIVIVRYAK